MRVRGGLQRIRTVFTDGPTPASARRHSEGVVTARHAEESVICSIDDLMPGADDVLIDLLIRAAERARTVDASSIAARCVTEEEAGWVRLWPGEHYRLLPALCEVVGATRVVEIGTYLGQGALSLRLACPHVITYDIVPWENFPNTVLKSDDFANGIEQRIGDLSDPVYFASQAQTLREADLIFVDGPKDGVFEPAFARMLYAGLAGRGSIVVWDDIRVMSMVQAWRDLPVPKLDATSFGHWSGTGLTHAV